MSTLPAKSPPPLQGVLETALYVDDLARARDFYEQVMGLVPMMQGECITAYAVAPGQVLLLFRRGGTPPGGSMPAHDGHGHAHFALAIDAPSLPQWENWLARNGVAVEHRTSWPRGGQSIYFRDPDQHLVELATPGLWANY